LYKVLFVITITTTLILNFHKRGNLGGHINDESNKDHSDCIVLLVN